MQLSRATLARAVEQNVLEAHQAEALWDFLERQDDATPAFRPAHILYYLGAMIALGAMTLFMNLGWERFGGQGLMGIAFCYLVVMLMATGKLLARPGLSLPAGITATLAVGMVPLGIYGLQHVLGMWPEGISRAQAYRDYHRYIDWRWLYMELGTLLAGVLVLWRYRLPFIMLPVAVTLWYLSMDLVPMLFGGKPAEFFSIEGRMITLAFGLIMTLVALWIDLRDQDGRDFAFWLYIFGVAAFWGALSSLRSDSELRKLLYALFNIGLIAVGAALGRRVFAVFGGLGVAGYLSYLSYVVFKDSLLFPAALTAIGLGTIAVGVVWQRHEAAIGTTLRALLPAQMRDLIARRAA